MYGVLNKKHYSSHCSENFKINPYVCVSTLVCNGWLEYQAHNLMCAIDMNMRWNQMRF